LGEPEDSGGQADTKKGGSTGGSVGIWNLNLLELPFLLAALQFSIASSVIGFFLLFKYR
jgi:hypothetical protein